tara:strand:- start:1556 stop:2230 length:675 start_codon:yes stop_codon:yes gene_type:complete
MKEHTFNPKYQQQEDWMYMKLGQEKRRFEYGPKYYDTGPISENPTFLDLGAYKGEWSEIMTAKYGGTSHMFEIQEKLIPDLQEKFKNNPNMHVHNFGLSSKTHKTMISAMGSGDNYSLHGRQGFDMSAIEIQWQNINTFLEENNISSVDVCKINIEGGEYDLLECMLDNGIHLICKNLQIQFHAQFPIPNFYNRYLNICDRLNTTHQKTLDFYFVWENWKINGV